ncbi:hypothetical protein [Streptosporangium sp. KLBMP 9127]
MGVMIRTATALTMLLTFPAVSSTAADAADTTAASTATAQSSDQSSVDGERLVFRFRDPRITESSGLAVSPAHEGIVYTHNDSDAAPVIYAVGPHGRTRAALTISGAEARDWEGIAVSTDPETGRGVLWIADIGDNLDGAWSDISVYRVLEPTKLRDATLLATRYRFRYDDGARNAEGIMINPRTNRLYVVSKEFAGSIYQAPRKLRANRPNILRKVTSAPLMATDAAYSPDGSTFVIRTYFSATLYSAPGKMIRQISMPSLKQAESITYTRDGKALLVGSEGVKSPVYEVPLPADLLPAPKPSASPPRSQPPQTPADISASATSPTAVGPFDGLSRNLILLGLALAAAVTTVIILIARRTR